MKEILQYALYCDVVKYLDKSTPETPLWLFYTLTISELDFQKTFCTLYGLYGQKFYHAKNVSISQYRHMTIITIYFKALFLQSLNSGFSPDWVKVEETRQLIVTNTVLEQCVNIVWYILKICCIAFKENYIAFIIIVLLLTHNNTTIWMNKELPWYRISALMPTHSNT